MGLHLKLIPFERERGDYADSYTVLNCDKDYDLFNQIQQLPEFPVPPNFNSYYSVEEDDIICYGVVKETPYGEELTYSFVKDLLRCKPSSDRQTNKAIWAYLKQLPPNTKVALYWH